MTFHVVLVGSHLLFQQTSGCLSFPNLTHFSRFTLILPWPVNIGSPSGQKESEQFAGYFYPNFFSFRTINLNFYSFYASGYFVAPPPPGFTLFILRATCSTSVMVDCLLEVATLGHSHHQKLDPQQTPFL